MNIVPQTYWDKSYENFVVQKASDDAITQLIKKYIPIAKSNQTAFEIGCFPARYLCILGDLGYTLNGLDTTPSVSKLKTSLSDFGYKTGIFENKSFEETNSLRYDIVASFGFIEHFTNYHNVINAHVDLLKDDGYLLITTPNFSGIFQYIYHRIFDNKNLKRHVVASMSPPKWKNQLEKAGLQIISYGYTGFGFWDELSTNNKVYKKLKKWAYRLFRTIHSISPDHPSIASYCYIVARKK